MTEIKTLVGSYQPTAVGLPDYPGFTRAAVLVLLFPTKLGLSTLLTKRTDLVDTHKGQIAFPGGMVDDGDSGLVSTALREAREEIGIDASTVQIAGTLDDVPVPSQFIITPIVGVTDSKPATSAHAAEVAEIFDAPLSFFGDEKNSWVEEREFRGVRRKVWFYAYRSRIIWGATAAIIRNLLSILPPL